MKFKYLLLICLAAALNTRAQTGYKTSIGINTFSARDIYQIYYNLPVVPQSPFTISAFNGISLKRTYGNYGIRAAYNIFKSSYGDVSDNCEDCWYGSTYVKGSETRIGAFKKWEFHHFTLYSGADLYYMQRLVWGNYSGGLSGNGGAVNSHDFTHGVSIFGGLMWTPVPRFSLSLETATGYDRTRSRDLISNRQYRDHYFPLNPVNALTVFYNFNIKQ